MNDAQTLKDEIKTIKPEDIVKGLKDRGKGSKQGKPPQERDMNDADNLPGLDEDDEDEADDDS